MLLDKFTVRHNGRDIEVMHKQRPPRDPITHLYPEIGHCDLCGDNIYNDYVEGDNFKACYAHYVKAANQALFG